MVTVISPDGKPIIVNANALQSAGVQNGMGMNHIFKLNKQIQISQELSICRTKVD